MPIGQPVETIRIHPGKWVDVVPKSGGISDAITLAKGEGANAQIRDAAISRYAKYLTKSTDPVSGGDVSEPRSGYGYDFNTDQAVAAAISGGFQEIISMNLFGFLLGYHNLFGEDGEYYKYTDDNEAAGKILEYRAESGAGLTAGRWDRYAKAVGSSVLYLSVDSESKLQEEAVSVTSFHCAFGDYLKGEKGQLYPVNESNIDNAAVVAMRLSGEGDGAKGRFAAWFGPSDVYENGRHVIYEAADWSQFPEPGDLDALEYTTDGEMVKGAAADKLANPLSLYASKMGDECPVYPFSVCRSNDRGAGLFPISTILYDDVLEFSLIASTNLGMIGKSVRGAQILTQEASASTSLPDNVTEGAIYLSRGQDLTFTGKQASDVKAGIEAMNDMLESFANYQHIPPQFVIPFKGGDVSGVALEQLLDGAKTYRETRVDANRGAVARRYQIERALVNSTIGSIAIPADVVEQWEPGEHKYPRDRGEVAADWKAQIDLGAADVADAVQDMWALDTREQAINWIEERAKEKADNPELTALLSTKPAQNVQGLSALQRRNQAQ